MRIVTSLTSVFCQLPTVCYQLNLVFCYAVILLLKNEPRLSERIKHLKTGESLFFVRLILKLPVT
ncbi:hypothetical protein FHX64_000969 [Microbacter margulisiae]|uniref:Uncharacterized protein n=1 Tax=Microbacter margulisiae TaxID=1350067 RepID=A0A7W5DPU0_9PORP|nr:hypothetical protein [Microbacter margulisiae]